jgi:hypothetical protein
MRLPGANPWTAPLGSRSHPRPGSSFLSPIRPVTAQLRLGGFGGFGTTCDPGRPFASVQWGRFWLRRDRVSAMTTVLATARTRTISDQITSCCTPRRGFCRGAAKRFSCTSPFAAAHFDKPEWQMPCTCPECAPSVDKLGTRNKKPPMPATPGVSLLHRERALNPRCLF